MGFEAAGAAVAEWWGGLSATEAALGTVAAASTYTASQAGKVPNVQAPGAAPQASKAPDATGVAGSQSGMGQAGGSPGVAQTFLTGPGGIDPSLLKLGKSTLLGGG